jgi:ribosomal protein S27E
MSRPRACDLPALEHSALIRAGIFKQECSITLQTTDREFKAEWDGSTLYFQQVDQRIHVSGPPTRLGGRDLYLHCPDCGNRRQILYLLDDRFTCRICGHIMATSHALRGVDKVEYQQQRIEQKIAGITSPTQWKQSKRKERISELSTERDRLEVEKHRLLWAPAILAIPRQDVFYVT